LETLIATFPLASMIKKTKEFFKTSNENGTYCIIFSQKKLSSSNTNHFYINVVNHGYDYPISKISSSSKINVTVK
jgi:hypothetical protein